MWCPENDSGDEALLAVRCRVPVGLEEGDSEAAEKTGSKVRITGHPKKVFEESKARGLHGREKAEPHFLVTPKEGKPMVKLILINKEALAKFFHGSKA